MVIATIAVGWSVTIMRMIDADAIPWEEYYVPDPDSNVQWDYKKEQSVLKPVIDQMPTINAVEVVHGYWISIRDKKFGGSLGLQCSVCRSRARNKGGNYCPNCGAKMDGCESK